MGRGRLPPAGKMGERRGAVVGAAAIVLGAGACYCLWQLAAAGRRRRRRAAVGAPLSPPSGEARSDRVAAAHRAAAAAAMPLNAEEAPRSRGRGPEGGFQPLSGCWRSLRLWNDVPDSFPPVAPETSLRRVGGGTTALLAGPLTASWPC